MQLLSTVPIVPKITVLNVLNSGNFHYTKYRPERSKRALCDSASVRRAESFGLFSLPITGPRPGSIASQMHELGVTRAQSPAALWCKVCPQIPIF